MEPKTSDLVVPKLLYARNLLKALSIMLLIWLTTIRGHTCGAKDAKVLEQKNPCE